MRIRWFNERISSENALSSLRTHPVSITRNTRIPSPRIVDSRDVRRENRHPIGGDRDGDRDGNPDRSAIPSWRTEVERIHRDSSWRLTHPRTIRRSFAKSRNTATGGHQTRFPIFAILSYRRLRAMGKYLCFG